MVISREDALSKVPEVTLIFWLIKIAAATLGETAGDAVSISGHPSLALCYFGPPSSSRDRWDLSSEISLTSLLMLVDWRLAATLVGGAFRVYHGLYLYLLTKSRRKSPLIFNSPRRSSGLKL